MQKQKRLAFKVTMDRVPGVKLHELRSYIKEAVRIWCRQYHPEDPRWEILNANIKVKSIAFTEK